MSDTFLSSSAPFFDFCRKIGYLFLNLPERCILLSIQLSLALILLRIFRKPLSKVASMKYIISLLCSISLFHFFLYSTFRLLTPIYLHHRLYAYTLAFPFVFPARFASQII